MIKNKLYYRQKFLDLITNQQLVRIIICNPKHSKRIEGIPRLCTLNQRNTTDKKVIAKETLPLGTNSIIQQA